MCLCAPHPESGYLSPAALALLDLEQYGGYHCCLNVALKTPNPQIMCINLRYKARELIE